MSKEVFPTCSRGVVLPLSKIDVGVLRERPCIDTAAHLVGFAIVVDAYAREISAEALFHLETRPSVHWCTAAAFQIQAGFRGTGLSSRLPLLHRGASAGTNTGDAASSRRHALPVAVCDLIRNTVGLLLIAIGRAWSPRLLLSSYSLQLSVTSRPLTSGAMSVLASRNPGNINHFHV